MANLWRVLANPQKPAIQSWLPKQNVAGSTPVTRSIYLSMTYDGHTETKRPFGAVFATSGQSAVTRRNPPFSQLDFPGLWRVCGESASYFGFYPRPQHCEQVLQTCFRTYRIPPQAKHEFF